MRRHDDPNVIDIIADYLGKFDDEGITGELVRSIGTKNGKIATERIIDSFFGLSETSKSSVQTKENNNARIGNSFSHYKKH